MSQTTKQPDPAVSAGHTPGPWQYNPASRLVSAQTPTKDFPHGHVVAQVSAGPGKNTNENAALIAAAPKLLEALRSIIGHAEVRLADAERRKANPAVVAAYRSQVAQALDAIREAEGQP